MKRLFDKWRELKLTPNAVITVLVIAFIVFLTMTLIYPERLFFSYGAFMAGGMLNIVNGLKLVNDKKKRSIGITYIFFGIIIIFLGFFSSSLMNR